MNFSVLLSIYYKENPKYLRDALNSIFNQTIAPMEIVLVKDGPLTSELDEMIIQYQNKYDIIKVIELPENRGLGYALNEGIKYCSYELVARMDTDDICKQERFEKQIKIFNLYPEIDIVGSWIDEFQENIENIVSIRKLPEQHDEIIHYGKSRNPINHPTVMFKKEAVLNAGGYLDMLFFEDYYLWIRMIKNGAKFYNIQESLLYFRYSPDLFKRRGGIKYVSREIKFQRKILEINFIGKSQFVKNMFIRICMRIIPNKLRSFLYKNILR